MAALLFFPGKKIMLKNIIFALLTLVGLATSHVIQAADEPPVEAVAAETVQAVPPEKEPVKQTTTNSRPINDNHVDYRYCLEFKNDRDIAECRYKK
jgi:hypothetical protein